MKQHFAKQKDEGGNVHEKTKHTDMEYSADFGFAPDNDADIGVGGGRRGTRGIKFRLCNDLNGNKY